MTVAVWDTYVRSKQGYTLHFDIIVPAEVSDADTVFRIGAEYLANRGEEAANLESEQCRFCHVEEPTAKMQEAIQRQGYYVLEMEDIPDRLPEHPTRRERILFLRAHDKSLRFAPFRGVTDEQLEQMIADVT